MLLVALKRLWSRPLLTLLSIAGVTLAVGLVASIPIFSKAVSFVVLKEELNDISTRTGRPLFSMRVYVLPSARYPLSMDKCKELGDHIATTIVSEVGLPLVAMSRHMETTGLIIQTRDEETPYGGPNTFLRGDINLVVLPGAESRLDIVQGESMESAPHSTDELNVWIHKTTADEMGMEPGERFEIKDLRRGVSVPVRVAGFWQASDPTDRYWFSNPDMGLRGKLLAREDDYKALVEPAFESQLGFASWYLVLDDSRLAAERMQEYSDGLNEGVKIISKFLPDTRVDSSPMEALDKALNRESNLTVLLFVFSVPLVGFLLYFLTLISTITIRWQQRITAVMVSRGMQSRQLILVSLIETLIIVGVGLPLGILLGIELAQLMGYTESFMAFTWRKALPVSPTAFNVPMVAAAVVATFLARLWPTIRSARTSVVSHERARARAPQKPFWQRFYLDFAILIPVWYAYRQLSSKGTLVPQTLMGEEGAGQDPLLFLVPALFTLALSLLAVRVFPLLMRLGDWLGGAGRDATFYLAFRQLSRQSSQYTSALLLVITSLSLGAFMASMAASLDRWLIDQVYYAVGSDVLIKQTTNPDEETPASPTEGAWVLPADSYLEIPGVTRSARVGMYPASIYLGGQRSLRGTFIGIDRLDLPGVVFWRSDFASEPLGALMNRLAQREDAVLVSSQALKQSNYEIGDKVRVRVTMGDVPLETEFTIAGTYDYFPLVYEESDRQTAVIGNLNFLFDQVGATLLHNIWLRIDPRSDQSEMIADVENMGVYISRWVDTRDEVAVEQAKVERVGIFGTLTIGFLAAAVLSGIGLLVYNYASLQERLFRFTILRAVGLSLMQVIGQVGIEYLVLMVYSVIGGAAIGVFASRLFIPFFQSADQNVLNPPMLIPLIAWGDIGRITGAFTIVLVIAQIAVISAALRGGVFQALRMGDRE
jgi:putative ABC transport system permease protein